MAAPGFKMVMGLNILIPKFAKAAETLPNWVERGLREGNFLSRMLAREKHDTQQRLVRAGAGHRNYQRKRGSEFELLSVMDGRTFHRWQQAEPGIIEDAQEFRKLVKDNRVMTPWRV